MIISHLGPEESLLCPVSTADVMHWADGYPGCKKPPHDGQVLGTLSLVLSTELLHGRAHWSMYMELTIFF